MTLCQEIDAHCRQAIIDNHHWAQQWADRRRSVPHIFADLRDQASLDQVNPRLPFLARWGQASRLQASHEQFCHTHARYCPSMVPLDFDVSGLPCQDNSRANHNRRFFEGKNSTENLAWAKRHVDLETPLLIIENTPET